MQAKSASRVLMGSIPLVAVLGVFASSAPVLAQQETSVATRSSSGRCSNATLFGNYGSSSDGVLLPAPGIALEFRALTLTRFDGRGNLTWREHMVVNGEPDHPGWITATGTYVVNPDCTGSMEVNTPNSPVALNLSLVVVKRGKEVRTLLDAHAILTMFTKVD